MEGGGRVKDRLGGSKGNPGGSVYQWLQIRIAGSESGSPVPHESEEVDGLTKKLTVVAATFVL